MQQSGRGGEEGRASHLEKQTESGIVRAVCHSHVNRQLEQPGAFKQGPRFDRAALLKLYRRQSVTTLDIFPSHNSSFIFSFVGMYCVIPPILAQWRSAICPIHCFSHSSHVLLPKTVHPLPRRTVTKSISPWSCVQDVKRKNGIRLCGRLWALSMEFRHSSPKQTLITYLRWIKRIWLITIQLLFYVMSNHLTKHRGLSRGGRGGDGMSLGFDGTVVNPALCLSSKLGILLLCRYIHSQSFFRFFMSL